MNEYVFEVQLVAAVRVHAMDENVAREVVSSVLGSPGTAEVRMANENIAGLGLNALVTNVDFSTGNSPALTRPTPPGKAPLIMLPHSLRRRAEAV